MGGPNSIINDNTRLYVYHIGLSLFQTLILPSKLTDIYIMSVRLAVSLPLRQFLHKKSICLYVCQYVYLSVSVISVRVCQYVFLFDSKSICLFIFYIMLVCVCSYVSLSLDCMYVCLSFCHYIYISVSMSLYLHVFQSVCISVCRNVYLAIYYICLSLFLSVIMSIYMSVCISVCQYISCQYSIRLLVYIYISVYRSCTIYETGICLCKYICIYVCQNVHLSVTHLAKYCDNLICRPRLVVHISRPPSRPKE